MKLINVNGLRETLLQKIIGYLLLYLFVMFSSILFIYCEPMKKGRIVLLAGKEGAMACTVAVESVIGEHYNDQIRELVALDPEKHKELLEIITKFRDEELEHHDIGLENDAEKAPFYTALTEAIKVGCRGAIWVAERV